MEQTVSGLKWQIGQLERDYRETQAENDKLLERVRILEEAIAQARQAKRGAKELSRSIDRMDTCSSWKGSRKRKFKASWEAIHDGSEKLVKKIDAYIDDIDGQRRQLLHQVDRLNLALTHAERGIEQLGRQMKKLMDAD